MPGILLAVSGGIDSMTMAHKFLRAGGAFAVAHCNFHLRGGESDGDALLVREWAESNGITFHGMDFDTAAYASEHSVSIEMAARELRYRWFCNLCLEHGYDAVAVAHNANDNAETLFLNLLRGTGLKGIGGMTAQDVLPYSEGRIRMLRPLLDMTREEIAAYALENGVRYREDRTNSDIVYKRNRIRNVIFPELKAVNPSFIRTINRDMRHFAQAEAIVGEWAEEQLAGMVSQGDECVLVDVIALTGQSHWRYLLYILLDRYGFNSSALGSLEELISNGSGAFSGRRFLSSEYELVTGKDKLIIRKQAVKDMKPVTVDGDGVYECGGARLDVRVLKYSAGMPLRQPAGTIMMDCAAIGLPFVLRGWRAGDWMCPLGMRGRKKLSDMFTDLKFDLTAKDKAVMIVRDLDADRVAALAGFRIDDSVKVTPATQEVVIVTML